MSIITIISISCSVVAIICLLKVLLSGYKPKKLSKKKRAYKNRLIEE